ncbi:hypothetical protein [Planctomicrobium sp. SH527]|uniref:hypothetical protein n=1 Tax=Planctomicrobium sp. SH527 TaxID=3448123 RepID=UPI003F5B3F7B
MITPPIIVLEGYDVEVFPNVQEAERYMEPIDVRNGEFECFDAGGQKLSVMVELKDHEGFWKRLFWGSTRECVIISDTDPSIDPSGLTRKLRDYFLLLSLPHTDRSILKNELEAMSLTELIQKLRVTRSGE